MAPAPEDRTRFDGTQPVGQRELGALCGLSDAEVEELVEYGNLQPIAGERLFDAACVPALRAALRLRADYDLDLFTAGLLFGFLRRIDDLERQVRWLQAHLPHGVHGVQDLREGPGGWREPHGHLPQ